MFQRFIKLAIFLSSSFALTTLIVVVIQYTFPTFFLNILLGHNLDSFPLTFQTMMWFPFSVAIVSSVYRLKIIQQNSVDLANDRLMLKNEYIATNDDVKRAQRIYHDLMDRKKRFYPFILFNALEAMHNTARFADVKDEIESKMELIYTDIDSTYANLRYIGWLLPTMGFMGTVYGISITVMAFGQLSLDDPEILTKVAAKLAVAFDTTLLSLIQSAVVMLIITFLENLENNQAADTSASCQNVCRRLVRQLQSKKPTRRVG